MFRKKHPLLPMAEGDTIKISLKGKALLCAVETGIVEESADKSGYNIGPFLKFWEEFSLFLPKEVKEQPDDAKEVINMVEEYRNQGADKQQ